MERRGTKVRKMGRKPKDPKVPLNTRIRETTMDQLTRFVGNRLIQCEVVDQAILAYVAKGGRAA